MTTPNHIELLPISELVALLTQLPEGVDPEFDNAYQELEREFAERRLTFGNR